MKVHTKTRQFNIPAQKLFAFLSDIENLPKWATSYIHDMKKEGSDYKITTPHGELYELFETNDKTMTIDMYCGPDHDQMWCWPARVMSDNVGGSIFAFTCIQMPEQPDDEFQAQLCELDKEFNNIERLAQ